MIFRKTRDIIEIGIYPVIYGYRVRAGVIGDGYVYLDYCAGADQKQVENIYSMVETIINSRMNMMKPDMSKNEKSGFIFKVFPKQNRKPMFNDPECFVELAKLSGAELIPVNLDNLSEERVKYLEKLFY